jgi:hypothetical protein
MYTWPVPHLYRSIECEINILNILNIHIDIKICFMYIHTYTYIIHTYIPAYTYIYVCVCVCACARARACVCVRICVCKFTHFTAVCVEHLAKKMYFVLKIVVQFVANESYWHNTKYFPQWYEYKRALNVFNLSINPVALLIPVRSELHVFNVDKDYLC